MLIDVHWVLVFVVVVYVLDQVGVVGDLVLIYVVYVGVVGACDVVVVVYRLFLVGSVEVLVVDCVCVVVVVEFFCGVFDRWNVVRDGYVGFGFG